jgi:hypothetical protein
MYEVTNWDLKHRWSKVVENKTFMYRNRITLKKKNVIYGFFEENLKLCIQIRVHQNKLEGTYEFITH